VMAANLVRDRDELEAAKAAVEDYAAELTAANRELQRAAQMRDDFLAMTNHELRTPLTAVVGYASTLVERWEEVPDDRRQEFVEAIRHQATRLRGLVEDLLTLSSVQAGSVVPRIETVDVAAAVDEAAFTVGATDEVANSCPPGLTVRADPQRLSQILTNYLSNALKYGDAPVTVDAALDGDSVEIRVQDGGPGVPEDFVPRLFDKFSRADRHPEQSGNGTGLGLAIVRLLAEAQSGDAWYEPAPTKGSVFCVRLPARAASQAVVDPPPEG
jgi:signal transduction histidine kinase